MTDIDHDKFGNIEEFTANVLSQEDLGSLVTVTLPSGATIQDILTGIYAGELMDVGSGDGAVYVQFQSVRRTSGPIPQSRLWRLNPGSLVWAERPLEGE